VESIVARTQRPASKLASEPPAGQLSTISTDRQLDAIVKVAAAFPASRRLDAITFWIHVDAGNPDMLDAIAKPRASCGPPQKLTAIE
jgi:hypothetical protein